MNAQEMIEVSKLINAYELEIAKLREKLSKHENSRVSEEVRS